MVPKCGLTVRKRGTNFFIKNAEPVLWMKWIFRRTIPPRKFSNFSYLLSGLSLSDSIKISLNKNEQTDKQKNHYIRIEISYAEFQRSNFFIVILSDKRNVIFVFLPLIAINLILLLLRPIRSVKHHAIKLFAHLSNVYSTKSQSNDVILCF